MPEDPTMEAVRPASLPEEDVATMTRASPVPGAGPVALDRGAKVDRYTILERIAAGGMGEVYAAYDPKLDRRVALKLLLHGGLAYEQRLAREAQAMARLSHPNVVGVFDTGSVNDRVFLAMEFIEGQTLRAWTRGAPRSVADIVTMYVEAGRGLAAAHGAGLVHRDFKPDNVLVSSQGAVKVTDFGLVRAEAESDRPWLEQEGHVAPNEPFASANLETLTQPTQSTEPHATPPSQETRTASASGSVPVDCSSGSLDVPMTEDGAVLGTLGYMAPEQYLSEPVNAQTDQFSFCVALYDALYGQKPFAGKGVTELASAALSGQVREPPRGHRVPGSIHRVLLRGLRSAKDERYPTMAALLVDLTRAREPEKRRRRLVVAVLGLVVAAGLLLYAQRVATARHGRLCAGADALANDAWNDDLRRDAERALLATGVPYAADTWARTRSTLDAYVSRWTTARQRACEATRIDGSQSEQAMALRLACLDRRREAVRALATAMRAADPAVAANAHPAALDLPRLEDCNDATSLAAVEPEPVDATRRVELTSLRADIATLAATVQLGEAHEATLVATSVVERARRLGYAPAIALALLWSGRAKAEARLAGAPPDGALADWAEAAFQADTGRDDATRADAATHLTSALAAAARGVEADEWSNMSEAALHRTGDAGARRARWLAARASVAVALGKPGDSAQALREALATARSSGDVRLGAEIERELAVALWRAEEPQEARRLIAEADDAMVHLVGESHPGRVPFIQSREMIEPR